jgi:hypothetical protein
LVERFWKEKKSLLKFLLTFAKAMKLAAHISTSFLKRKLVTTLFIGVSLATFAALGDGGKRSSSVHNSNLLSSRTEVLNYKTFSLKSGYSYRGNAFLNTDVSKEKVIMLNTVMTYQKGNATYILPLKKKLLLGKVTFTPTATNR